jgi:hypothetical protein
MDGNYLYLSCSTFFFGGFSPLSQKEAIIPDLSLFYVDIFFSTTPAYLSLSTVIAGMAS